MLGWLKRWFTRKEPKENCGKKECTCAPVTEQAKFEIYEDVAGFWRYRMMDHLGRKMATSGQAFSSSELAFNEVKYIREHAKNAKAVRIIRNPKKT